MKRKALVSLSAVVPLAAFAIGSALALPPKAMASELSSPATTIQEAGTARPDWHLRIISPLTVVVSDKVAPSGIRAATPTQAATLLDS